MDYMELEFDGPTTGESYDADESNHSLVNVSGYDMKMSSDTDMLQGSFTELFPNSPERIHPVSTNHNNLSTTSLRQQLRFVYRV